MRIIAGTLARYFGLRFVNAVLVVFASIFVLVVLIDYIELTRRAGDIPNVSAALVAKTSLYRVPQVVERILPFCVLIGAMSCYLNLSRRLELVVARSAGISAWQFVMPAIVAAFVFGIIATAIYNPISATLQERSKRFEAELFGQTAAALGRSSGTFWMNQRTDEGQAIINAVASRDQGINLNGVSIYVFDIDGRFKQRIEARAAVLVPGAWVLRDTRIYGLGTVPTNEPEYRTQDQSHSRASPRKLCHARNRAILGSSRVYPNRRTRGACSGRLQITVSKAFGAPIFASGDGSSCSCCKSTLLPVRRDPEDGFKWHSRRVSALRFIESD